MKDAQIAIVGGGIAGLVAAAALAREGLAPCLFEAAHELGGRAQTRLVDGFRFNQGPHGLYVGGALNAQLARHGLSVTGRGPRLSQAVAVWGEKAYPLPVGRAASGTAAPLSAADTACLAETFARIAEGAYGGKGVALRAFTDELPQAVAVVIEAFVRLSSYTHAPQDIDCKAALDQMRLSFDGAIYVDGGWRTLVSKLAGAATSAGAVLRPEDRVVSVRRDRAGWRVELAGARAQRFDAVILAVPPAVALELFDGSPQIAAAARAARPVQAVGLDVGLAPHGEGADFAIGMDAPTYLSLHSSGAELTPPDGGLLHLLHYLAPGEAPTAAHVEALQQSADRLRPGWRDRRVQTQRLLGITVAHDYPRWGAGGRRAAVVAADAPGVFLAGDWVGDEGMLSDAAAASGAVAAREAAALLAGAAA